MTSLCLYADVEDDLGDFLVADGQVQAEDG